MGYSCQKYIIKKKLGGSPNLLRTEDVQTITQILKKKLGFATKYRNSAHFCKNFINSWIKISLPIIIHMDL